MVQDCAGRMGVPIPNRCVFTQAERQNPAVYDPIGEQLLYLLEQANTLINGMFYFDNSIYWYQIAAPATGEMFYTNSYDLSIMAVRYNEYEATGKTLQQSYPVHETTPEQLFRDAYSNELEELGVNTLPRRFSRFGGYLRWNFPLVKPNSIEVLVRSLNCFCKGVLDKDTEVITPNPEDRYPIVRNETDCCMTDDELVKLSTMILWKDKHGLSHSSDSALFQSRVGQLISEQVILTRPSLFGGIIQHAPGSQATGAAKSGQQQQPTKQNNS
jgi:hypothetical protein